MKGTPVFCKCKRLQPRLRDGVRGEVDLDEWVFPIGYLMNGENTVFYLPYSLLQTCIVIELLIGTPINCHAYWGWKGDVNVLPSVLPPLSF